MANSLTVEIVRPTDEPMPTFIAAYLDHLRRRNLSPNTLHVRRIVLGAIGRDIGRLLITATTTDLRDALDARNLSPASTYSYISHLHSFYAWAVREGHRTDDPTLRLDRPRRDRLLPRPIATAELTEGIGRADGHMRAWLTLAAYAGLRCAEIATLDAADVDIPGRTLIVRGKGRKERRLPMHPRIAEELAALDLAPVGPVFRRADGEPYTAKQVSADIARFFRRNCIRSTAHTLRHWFGTELYDRCLDLRVVQEALGHESPATTQIYVDWSRDRLARAMAAL